MKIKTIDRVYCSDYRSMNSKFIGILMPFPDIDELNSILHQLKKEHPKANHICFAYRNGFINEQIRANDDNEPSGSAGKPLLNQLYSFELQNCILLVVRYFGGTKLGIPGLIEAYKAAAHSCCKHASIVEQEESKIISLESSHDDYYDLIKLLKANTIAIVNSSYTEGKYFLKIEVPISKMDLLMPYV